MRQSLISLVAVGWLGLVFSLHILVTPGSFSDILQKIPPVSTLFEFLIAALNKPYIF